METVRNYLKLTKPGVMAGNVLTAIAGYFLATADYGFDWLIFVGMLGGMVLVVGGACALNNYLDRDIDAKMTRTKKRPSVSAGLSPTGMQVFAYGITIFGLAVLYFMTNVLTVVIGLIGFVTYVWLYGAWAKRKFAYGMAVGAIPGALPIAGGYAAASGQIDLGLVLVFLIILFWQLPEFYSISIYRAKEYKAAGVPVFPIAKSVRSTITQIVAGTTLYLASALGLTFAGYTGMVYFVVILIPGLIWLNLAFRGLSTGLHEVEVWARKMFKGAMYTILLACLMLSIGAYLP